MPRAYCISLAYWAVQFVKSWLLASQQLWTWLVYHLVILERKEAQCGCTSGKQKLSQNQFQGEEGDLLLLNQEEPLCCLAPINPMPASKSDSHV